jgi:hypothetical protein
MGGHAVHSLHPDTLERLAALDPRLHSTDARRARNEKPILFGLDCEMDVRGAAREIVIY